MKNKRTTLEQDIRAAFHCAAPETILSREEADDLYVDIVMLDNQSVRKLLPILLLRTMPGHLDGDRDNSDLVITLDGALLKKKKGGAWSSNPELHRLELEYSYGMYSSFSKDEARSVLRWLKEIAVINDCWKLCSNHIISAIIFWQSVFNRQRPPTNLSSAEMAATKLEELFYVG